MRVIKAILLFIYEVFTGVGKRFLFAGLLLLIVFLLQLVLPIYIVVAIMNFLIGGWLVILGLIFSKNNIGDVSDTIKGGLLGRRLQIIKTVFGNKKGTWWIHFLGWAALLTGMTLIGTAVYLVFWKPVHLF